MIRVYYLNMTENVKKQKLSIFSILLGLIGIFILSPIISPIAIILGFLGIRKKEYVLSSVGIFLGLLGLLTLHPYFFSLFFIK